MLNSEVMNRKMGIAWANFLKVKRKTEKENETNAIQFEFSLQTSSSQKTTTMTTPAKLFGKNLGEYDEVDVDELLAQLSAEEIKILAKEVDPDVSDYWSS